MPIFFGIWPLLIQSATLQPLKVKELDKCLTRDNLPSVGRRDDKVKRITATILVTILQLQEMMSLTMILNMTVNRKVDLMMMKLPELFLKMKTIQQMKNSFLRPNYTKD